MPDPVHPSFGPWRRPSPGRRMLAAVAAALAAAIAVPGCTTGPAYVRPEVQAPQAYRNDAPWKEAQPADDLPKGRWWAIFGDETLDGLMERVGTGNQELAASAARVNQARAAAAAAGAGTLPSVSLDPSAQRARTADDLSPTGSGEISTTLRVPLDLSYEADLFGRVRQSSEAAGSDYSASKADFVNLLLTLQAETARNYFALRALDAETDLLRRTMELRQKNFELVDTLYRNGQVSRLDLARAQAELASAKADMAVLARQRAAREQALAILVGEPASTFSLPHGPLDPSTEPPVVSPGLPSALLERRPDVAAAERRLMAANARIGVAKSAFFPSIRLTGSAGFASREIGSLFEWGNRTWALGPFISLPIFDGGRNRAGLELARGRWEEAVASYRQRVLTAFAEVEGALSDLASLAEQASALSQAAAAAREAAELTDKRYRAGRVSYLEVVVSERTVLSAEVLAVRTLGQRLQASVTLVKALGGGWGEGLKEP